MDEIIGRNIRRVRYTKGLRQEDLGEMLNITYQQIQKYENGSNAISAGKLLTLSRLLQINVVEFFVGIECQAESKASKLSVVAIKMFERIRSETIKKKFVDLMRTLH